jgi:hypothetical protein
MHKNENKPNHRRKSALESWKLNIHCVWSMQFIHSVWTNTFCHFGTVADHNLHCRPISAVRMDRSQKIICSSAQTEYSCIYWCYCQSPISEPVNDTTSAALTNLRVTIFDEGSFDSQNHTICWDFDWKDACWLID